VCLYLSPPSPPSSFVLLPLPPHSFIHRVDLTCAFALTLEGMVMDRDRSAQLRFFLTTEEVAMLKDDKNAPLTVTELISQEVVKIAKVNPNLCSSPQYSRILGFVDTLGHSVNQCERLQKHPVPQVYTAHFLRMLALWTLTLPFTLVDKIPLKLMPLAMGVIAWAFYGLNEIGVMVQFPFTAGIVDLKSLWTEIIYDTRECFESIRLAKTQSGAQ